MKKQILRFSALVLFTIAIVSCSSDDDSNDNNTASEGQLVATIEGSPFTAQDQSVIATLFGDFFNLTAINSLGETIVINVSNASEGTFDLSAAANTENGAVYTINGENAYGTVTEGGSGSITISHLDTENLLVSGTFEFIATRLSLDDQGNTITETVTINQGAFNNLSLETDVAGDANNSLTANVDGVAVNTSSVTVYNITLAGSTTINISATNNSTHQNIGLSFPEDTSPGTYELSSFFGDYKGSYNPLLGGSTNIYTSSPGTITITSFDAVAGTAEGSFEFSAKRLDPNDPDITYEITNGEFSIEF